MRCGGCGADSVAGKNFCGDCGARLQAACPACGADVEPDKRFCGDCGAELGAQSATSVDAPPTPFADEPVAERRMCSVLFCDLVGFTTLSESRDPEEVRELLTRYFDIARTVVARYGGVIEKFIGDAVMAVWGTPVATEEDAERTVRAALDLVEAVHQLGLEIEADELGARAGVITGDVAVTIGATNEGMVAGDAVNTAARIQAAASPGAVYVDPTTRRLAASAISFQDEGEHVLKGKAEPQHLWRAVRVVSNVGGAQRVDGLEAPLMGRGAEMRSIRELLHASVERRQSRLVLVSGPAGVGKSRIGWEFEKYTDGLAETMRWHRGRCLSYGEGLVFWALAEIIRQRLGIAEEDLPEVAAVKLTSGLERYVPDVDDRAFIGTRIGRLLGVPVAGDTGAAMSRKDMFAGWRRFFESMAATDPVVILIEDAHHADNELLDFLDHLVDWARDRSIFVLVFARPEIEQRRPGFGSGRNRVSITLDPLDQTSMDALVDALIPGAPEQARTTIVERSQGIPLYAVESIRALIDRDVVQPIEGVYRVVGDIGELEVPDSLHALLAARLDVLDPRTRHVLTDAAVLGTSFPAEAVVAVSGLEADEVARILSDLLRREVLEVSADPLSPERGSYRFSQEMLRQVAYETLSRRDRKSRHLVVAAHLQRAFPNDGEEVIDVVARHYIDALEAVPDDSDSSEIRESAIAAYTRAADRAIRSGSPARAATCFCSAADLLDQTDVGDLRSARMRELAADSLLRTDRATVAIPIVERAIDQYVHQGDHRSAARARVALGRALRRVGRHTDARFHLEAALTVLRPDPDVDTVEALEQLGSVEMFTGGDAAGELTAEALALAQALDLGPERLGRVLLTRGMHFDIVGQHAEAVMYLREAARLTSEIDPGTSIVACLNLANVLNVDDPAGAADAARQALDTCDRSGELFGRGTVIYNLLFALVAVGDWEGAAAVLERYVDDHALDSDEHLVSGRAWFAALRGDVQQAESQVNELHRFAASEDPQDIAVLLTIRAFIADARGRPDEALTKAQLTLEQVARALPFNGDDGRWVWPLAARSAHAVGDLEAERELLALCESHPIGHRAPLQRAEARLIEARLAAADHHDDAADRFDVAIDALRSMSTPFHLAHGLLDHAAFLIERGETESADLAIGEARAVADRLGCRPLLARADRLTAVEAVSD